MVTKGIVLRHKISTTGLEVGHAQVYVVETLMPPTTIKGIISFLGYARFYRRFVKGFSKISRPLCKLLEKEVKFEFDEDCKCAFEDIKTRLIRAPIIETPYRSKDFDIMCDAIDYTVGSILRQRTEKIFKAIYHASKTFNEA